MTPIKLRPVDLGFLEEDGSPAIHSVPVVIPPELTFREKVVKWWKGHLCHCYFCHQTFNYYPFSGMYWIYPTPAHRENDKPEWLCGSCGKEYMKQLKRS